MSQQGGDTSNLKAIIARFAQRETEEAEVFLVQTDTSDALPYELETICICVTKEKSIRLEGGAKNTKEMEWLSL